MASGSTILVTGIGGNVGQGLLRILRGRFPNIRLVGTDIGMCTAGHHFCDVFQQVPYSYEPGYVDAMALLCRREDVNLVIPATDYEVYYLGLAVDRLPPLLVSPAETARIFLDKFETFTAFRKAQLPFAESYLPSTYPGHLSQIIVKPREGRGSRNIFRNPPAPQTFDDSYMVQDLATGQEITTAFYVTRTRQLHGHITFVRALSAGMTERCQVTFAYDEILLPVLQRMIETFDIRGPCNLQSIVTETGSLVPFEVNCRYSGTSSIRSQLGFDDVAYGVQEYLLNLPPQPPAVKAGAAIRIFMDIIYPGQSLEQLAPGSGSSYIF
jgi:carbamoyl-phosphate synthase large subunit